MAFLASAVALGALMAAAGASCVLVLRDLRVFPVHAASWMGVGAYAAALLVRSGVTEMFLLIVAAAIASMIWAVLVAAPIVSRGPDRQILYLIAAQLLFELVLRAGANITRGASGLSVPGPIEFFGMEISNAGRPLIAIAISGVLLVVAFRLQNRQGAITSIVGAGYVQALGLGIQSRLTAVTAHAICGALCGAIGAIYATYVGIAHPASFGVDDSIWLVIIASFAAWRPFVGAILGAVAVVGLFELFRFVGMPAFLGEQARQGAAGLGLVALTWWQLSRGRVAGPGRRQNAVG